MMRLHVLIAAGPSDRRAERDALLRLTAAKFFPDVSRREAAKRLHVALSRYRSSAWVRERVLSECPKRHHGRIEAHCWSILCALDRAPSVECVRKIISAAR